MAEGVSRIHRFVGPVFVSAAVKLVGSALGGEVVEAAGYLTELGREVGGLHGELGDAFHRGSRNHGCPIGVGDVGGILAFEIDLEAAVAAAGGAIDRRVVAG